MGKLVVSVTFCPEISPICKRKIPQIDPEMSKCLTLCRFWCNFCTLSERFRSNFQHKQLNSERTTYALPFWTEHCSVLLQKHITNPPEESNRFNIFVFVQLVYFLNRFGVRRMSKTKNELIIIDRRFKNIEIFVGFWHFQWIFVWDWIISVEKSSETLQMMKLGPKHIFQKRYLLNGRKFPPE